MNIIIEIINLLIVFTLSGIVLYQLNSINKILLKTKIKMSQNTIALRVLFKKLQSVEVGLKNQSKHLNSLNEQPWPISKKTDSIATEYERARRILKKGTEAELNTLHNFDMTEEEIELLTDLMQAEEMNN